MGFGVGSDYRVPEINASVGTLVEQVAGRDKVFIEGVQPDDPCGAKWVVRGEAGPDDQSV